MAFVVIQKCEIFSKFITIFIAGINSLLLRNVNSCFTILYLFKNSDKMFNISWQIVGNFHKIYSLLCS